MFTLYGAKGSGAAAPEAALRIADVPFRWVEAASWEPGPGLEELQRVNPLAQIPTLVLEDGTVMTESAAILIWLGLRYPSSGLLAAEPAQAIRGLVYIAANCYAAIGVIDYPARFCAPCDEAMSERIRAGARARLHEYWRIFADQFGSHMNAGQPGALDLLAAVVSRWSGARAHLRKAARRSTRCWRSWKPIRALPESSSATGRRRPSAAAAAAAARGAGGP